MSKDKFLSSLYASENVYAEGKALPPTKFIPTPSPSLNWALGGGVPVGSLIQHCGAPSSGKSLLAMIESVGWQNEFKDKSFVVVADFEHSQTIERAKQIGIDTSKEKFLIWKHKDNLGGEFFDWLNDTFLEGCVENGIHPFIILDSKDCMLPPAEVDRTSSDQEYGAMARFLKRVLKRTVALLDKCGGTMVIVNQLVLKIGELYGNPETSSGGNALKHASAVDIWVKKIDKKDELVLDSRGETIGHRVSFKLPKNKVAVPFRKGAFKILYEGKIIDQHEEIFEMSKRLGVVGRPNNRTYEMETNSSKEGRCWSSKLDFQEAIRNRSEIRDELIKRCNNYENESKKFDNNVVDSDE